MLICELFQERREGHDQKTCHQVTDAVDDVKRKADGDPREHLLEIESEHQRLRGGVEDAEAYAVKEADGRIDHARELFRHFFRQEHRDRPKDRPDIEIWHPPKIEACV